jgi:hypothetical protein
MARSWPSVTAMPQEEMARSEPLAAQATVSVVGWTKGDTTEVSLEVGVIEQGPAFTLLTPSTTAEIVPWSHCSSRV